MKLNQLFPGDWLKAPDLNGREIPLTIEKITMEDVGDDKQKPILHFHKTKKGLVLNKTNALVIADAYGEETDQWLNQPIIIYPARVTFKGQMVDAIRVKIPDAGVHQAAATEAPTTPADPDEIPF